MKLAARLGSCGRRTQRATSSQIHDLLKLETTDHQKSAVRMDIVTAPSRIPMLSSEENALPM